MYSIFNFKCNMSSIHSSCQSSVRNTSQPVPVKSESEFGGGGARITGVVFVDSGKLFPLLRNAIPYHVVYSFQISRWYRLAGIRHTYLQRASNISYLGRYNSPRQHSHVPLNSRISVQGKFSSAVMTNTVRNIIGWSLALLT